MTRKVPVLAYSAEIPTPAGLDAKTYSVTVLVDRRDSQPLSDAELAKLRDLFPPTARRTPAARSAAKKPAAALDAQTGARRGRSGSRRV